MRKSSLLHDAYETLSSMRFAISLLVILALAAIIGTVLKQNESYTGYLVELGPYWFEAFRRLGLYDVYGSGWFMTILGFLVVSTTLCIYRHTPQFVQDMRSFREQTTLKSLRLFKHHTPLDTPLAESEQLPLLQRYLQGKGYRFKVVNNSHAQEPHTLLAAKTGTWQRAGYFAAHLAIVLICLAALMDGSLSLRMQQWFNGKHPETRDLPVSQLPEASRLNDSNRSFRGNVSVAEGERTDVVFLTQDNGFYAQTLPFTLELKRFQVEHYPTGQPKLFASDIVVTRKDTGEKIIGRTEVNKPVIVDGVAIYQASFSDGGSALDFQLWPLAQPGAPALKGQGTSLRSQQLTIDGKPYTLEFQEFRLFNIEDFSNSQTKPKAKTTADQLQAEMADALKETRDRALRNVGPSITFRLRDAAGQAREFQNYMQPIQLEGASYFISAMRTDVGGVQQFFRFPADAEGKLDGYMKLRKRLLDPANRDALSERVARATLGQGVQSSPASQQFQAATQRMLDSFARSGFAGMDEQLRKSVPEAKRSEVAQLYLRIMRAAAMEAFLQDKPEGYAPTETDGRFVIDSMVSISISKDYGMPYLLQLDSFQQRQASGFQIARAPFRPLVYLGCLLLVLGVFAMFYLSERRIWLVCRDGKVEFSMAGNRQTLQFEAEYRQHQAALATLLRSPTQGA